MGVAGCGGEPQKVYNVEISLSDQIQDEVVLVDIVARDASDLERFKEASEVQRYFNEGDSTLRDEFIGERWSFTSSGEARGGTLSDNDKLWIDWKIQANTLGVLARIGAATYDAMLLPLDGAKWEGNTIKIEVKPSGLVLRSVMLE